MVKTSEIQNESECNYQIEDAERFAKFIHKNKTKLNLKKMLNLNLFIWPYILFGLIASFFVGGCGSSLGVMFTKIIMVC